MQCPAVMQSGMGSELQYMFMVDAMKTYPDHAGYMFMQEDVVLGFWNFQVRHSKDKVWRAINFPDPDPRVWHKMQNLSLLGASRHGGLVPASTRNQKFPFPSVQAFVQGFTAEERQRLYQRNSATGSEAFRMAFSDMHYIPARFRQQFAHHCERALNHGVVHETMVGVPIVLDAIVPDDGFELAMGGALFKVTDSVQKIALYDPCWDFYHKIKCSRPIEWAWLVETVMRYGQMTQVWNCGELGAEGLTSYARVGAG